MNETSFLNLSFTPLSLNDQPLIDSFFKRYPQQLSWFTFPNLFGWSTIYRTHWLALPDDTLLLTAYINSLKQHHLIQPVGKFTKDSQQLLLETIAKSDYTVKLLSVSSEFIQDHPEFCSHFHDSEIRDYSNYLYRAADLALMKGRLFEKKRNLIYQLENNYPWSIHAVKTLCTDCPEVLMSIGSKEHPDETLQDELKVLHKVLEHFDQLRLKGLVIKIDGKPVAFSIFADLNPSTKVVIFEKADRHFKGLYQLINRETSKAILAEGFELINREEDLGNEGLRQAKMSYHPVELVASHTLTFKMMR